jgi:hypothetical protein
MSLQNTTLLPVAFASSETVDFRAHSGLAEDPAKLVIFAGSNAAIKVPISLR